ncbi:MAG: protein kinase [Myxococcales bacterium]|nr:protein kinase [Myxococcales bacterium]
MDIELGPFKLIRPIGKGGMGVVWHGVHYDTGIPVAVKVITQRVSRDERTLKAFRNEVRAVAGLDHPGIVWVLDYGEVSPEASIASGRQLTEGSPYLVMEVATGGTLTSYKEGLPWPELRAMLVGLLDALAHAHARGVIHRDLKPGNVLICGPQDLRPGLKLTDFGIAHAREETVSDSMSNHVIGTLHYMAPEQIRADWRDYGPWTDLYALGTIAYRLATGDLPYKGKRGASLMVAQLNHRPPPLEPTYPVPDGFEDWLLTMLRKEHPRRFQCAADAAMALAALTAPSDVLGSRPPPKEREAVFVDEHVTALVLDDEPHTVELLDDGGEVTAPSQAPPLVDLGSPEVARRRGELDRLRPPIPRTWKRPAAVEDGGIRLRGAGLGLWGMRSLSLVDREAERDSVWKAFLDVTATRNTRVVLVRGPKGCGKTALVKWLGERAVEVGAAHLVRVDHGADVQPHEGIRQMLRKYFKVARLDAEQRKQRVLEVCDVFGETDEADAQRLERLLDPVDPLATDGGERHSALRWFFGRMGADRPLILWLDDAHYGMDGLQLVLSMLRSPSARVLVVLTVDDDVLAERRLERSFVDRIAQNDAVLQVALGPLANADIATYVREGLGLAPQLAEQVAGKAAGMPQFATQVVGEWVGNGALVRGADGYVLRRGTSMPRSLDQVWDARIRQVTEGLPADARLMLELAAVLGDAVDDGEWARVCDDPDGRLESAGGAPLDPEHVKWRAEMLDRLLSAGLAEDGDSGWTFTAAELRSTLLEQAAREDRLAGHHATVASMLVNLHASPERLGQHLVAAGDLDAGIDALLRGVRERQASVGPRPALALLESAEAQLDAARVPPSDPRRGRIWVTRAEIMAQRGRLGDALKDCERVLAAKGRGWEVSHAGAWFIRGDAALLRKEADSARESFRRFDQLAPHGDLKLHRAAMHHGLSLLAENDGDAATALKEAEETVQWLGWAGTTLVEAWKLLGMRGLVSSRAGTLLANLERRRRAYEVDGQLEGVAECWMVLASATHKANQQALAERCLEHGARLFERAESAQGHRARLQLALMRAAASDWEGAEKHAVEVANRVRDAHRKPVLLKAHAILAVCAAGRERWALLGDHVDVIGRLVGDTGAAEKDVGWALAKAGELARKAGRTEPARGAWTLAAGQYQQLGDDGQVRRLQALLGTA